MDSREFLRGHYVDNDGWHQWIGEMRHDALQLKWRRELSSEDAGAVDAILRAHCTTRGPIAFGGPWTYILPSESALQIDRLLR